MSTVYKQGDRLEVEVVKIIPNGLGLCFAEGLTVFVPLSAPGDRLRVEIADLRGKTAFAGIVEVIEPSPHRVEPPCEYFGLCGGCDFQQMSYEAQLDAKIAILRDCLKRIAKISEELPIEMVHSPEQFGYRIRTQLHADPAVREMGFFRRQSHEVIAIRHCPILDPGLDGEVRKVRDSFEWPDAPAEMITIEAGFSDGTSSVFSDEILGPVNELSFNAAGREYFFDATAFFQANRYLIGRLIEEAVKGSEGKLAVDLYCGIGLFTLPLAEAFERVIGVESSDSSFRFAEKNARVAGAQNVEFRNSRVKQFLQESYEEIENADLIVVDPPRSGVKGKALGLIARAKPREITYVSCNPSTLARDIRILLDYGYEIGRFTALDLFPQTHHVEAVVRLRRTE